MIVLGLAGGVNTHKFKWGYYAMSCFCEVAINIGLLFCGMRSAMARGGGISKVYAGLAGYLSILWWGYPIVWGLAEGANVISSDAEVTISSRSSRVYIHCMLAILNYGAPLGPHKTFALAFICICSASLLLGTNIASILCHSIMQQQGLAFFLCKLRWCSLTHLTAIAGCCICWVGYCCQGVLWLAGHGHIPNCQ